MRSIAEDKLAHYNCVLEEQAMQLQSELEEIEMPYAMIVERRPLHPATILAEMREEARGYDEMARELEREAAALADIRVVKSRLGVGARGRDRRGKQTELFR